MRYMNNFRNITSDDMREGAGKNEVSAHRTVSDRITILKVSCDAENISQVCVQL